MQTLEKTYLRDLRFKTGLGQEDCANRLGCARTTVIRWEATGKIRDEHLEALRALASATEPVTMKPIGRPRKTWKLRNRSKREMSDNGIRYYLWLPDDVDHRAEIQQPPVGPGAEWTVRMYGDPGWYDTRTTLFWRMRREGDGREIQVSIFEMDASYNDKERPIRLEDMPRFPDPRKVPPTLTERSLVAATSVKLGLDPVKVLNKPVEELHDDWDEVMGKKKTK